MKLTRTHIVTIIILTLIIIGGGAFFFFPHAATAPVAVSTNTATTSDISTSDTSGVVHKNGYTIEQVPINILDEMPNPSRTIQFGASVPTEIRAVLSAHVTEIAAAIKKDPTNAGNWFDLAIQYHTADDFDGARAVWEGLVKLLPKDTVSLGNLGRLYEFDLHDFAKAESYFKQALAVAPKETTFYIELHELYAHSYKVGTGANIAIAKQGVAMFPNSTDFYVYAGDDYLAQGDTKNARSYYEQAMSIARTEGNTNLMTAIGQKLQSL